MTASLSAIDNVVLLFADIVTRLKRVSALQRLRPSKELTATDSERLRSIDPSPIPPP
jgi:hypothetical protein